MLALEARVKELEVENAHLKERPADSDDKDTMHAANARAMDLKSVDSMSPMMAVSTLKRTLAQRESEVRSLRKQLEAEARGRETMRDTIVRLEASVMASEGLSSRLAQLEAERHEAIVGLDAALQIVGEKEEECEALRSDIDDIKATFRAQIEMLCAGASNPAALRAS